MKPLSQTDKLVLTALIIVLIGITGWVVWPILSGVQKPTKTNTVISQKTNDNAANTNVSNINTQPANLNASVDTSNWKTYRNEELGFEVKYPEGWYHIHDTTINAEIFSSVRPPYPDSYYGMIGRDAGPLFLIGTTTAEEILAEKGKEIISKENFQINNIKGKKIYSVTKYPSNPSDYYIGVYIEYDGKKYAIEGSLGTDNLTNDGLFNAFLSSLILTKNN